MIGIYSCSLLTTVDPCTQVHAHHARTYRRCVFEKCFASLHFTDNVEDLVSSVAVGLLRISSQRFVWFAMFCRQTEAVKRKVRNLRQNTCQLESRNTQTLYECKLTYGWMSITEIFFALLKVICNRQSFACCLLLFHQRKINAGLTRKVAVSKFS